MSEATVERQEMSEEEKQVFICDLKSVCSEYFETGEKFSVDVTGTEKGYSVCVLFDAVRIKNFKKPR